MKIPIFLSCPTTLTKQQAAVRAFFCSLLDELNLEPRALGKSEYPAELPLREVYVIARHCAGGVILGFAQLKSTGVVQRVVKPAKPRDEPRIFPTAWNNLEAGILYSLGKPLLVFREKGITGGVFDNGVSDVFVHDTPDCGALKKKRDEIWDVLLKWQAKVRDTYYSMSPYGDRTL